MQDFQRLTSEEKGASGLVAKAGQRMSKLSGRGLDAKLRIKESKNPSNDKDKGIEMRAMGQHPEEQDRSFNPGSFGAFESRGLMNSFREEEEADKVNSLIADTKKTKLAHTRTPQFDEEA